MIYSLESNGQLKADKTFESKVNFDQESSLE